MLVILSVMLVVLALSGLVLGVVAYPMRGREPARPWLARLLTRVATAVAVIDAEMVHRPDDAAGAPTTSPRAATSVPAVPRPRRGARRADRASAGSRH